MLEKAPGVDETTTHSNPYAAPSADLSELPAEADASAVSLRRAHLGREKAVKRVAWLNLVLAIIWSPAAIGSLLVMALSVFDLAGSERFFPPGLHPGLALAGLALFHGSVFSLNVALFLGLRRLRAWARWTMVGLAALSLVVLCVYLVISFRGFETNWGWYLGTLVPWVLVVGAVFYVLLTPPSGIVFSREYQSAVARTRGYHLQAPTESTS
jgi:hypothetical protein